MSRTSAKNLPAAFANPPSPPVGMRATAKVAWNNAVGSRPSSEWTAADLVLLSQYAICCADIARLTSEIEKDGETIVNAGGNRVLHPLVALRGQREKFFLSLATQLKLSPAGRYTSKDAGRLSRYGQRNAHAQATLDDDDGLLSAGSLQ